MTRPVLSGSLSCRGRLQARSLAAQPRGPHRGILRRPEIFPSQAAARCQGFLYGLAAGGIKQGSKMPADSTELMRDFIEISQAAFDDEESENSEDDYMQLVEFVRVGVLLINEELQPMKLKKPVNTDKLH